MAHAIQETLDRIYRQADLRAAPAVLHAVAVCRDAAGGLSVLRTEVDGVPKSADDRFVLGVARARANAIVTTGANLRAEPRLSHHLHADAKTAAALRNWSGRAPARVCVLSASGDLPSEHRVFSETPVALLVTGEAGAQRLVQNGHAPTTIEIRARTSIRDTVAFAQQRLAAGTVLIEAGPTTARELYSDRILVDELMLSICNQAVQPDAVGPQLFDIAQAQRLLGPLKSVEAGAEAWSFYRLFPRQLDGSA